LLSCYALVLVEDETLEQLVDECVRGDAALLGDVIYLTLETALRPLDERQPVRDGRLPGSGSGCHDYIVSQEISQVPPPCDRKDGDLVR